MAGQPLSPGQQAAVKSIRAAATISRGALTLDDFAERSFRGVLHVPVWLNSASLPHAEPGRRLRPWEPINLRIPERFPDIPPIASAGHNDFNSLPHVAEGSGFCLRISPGDWDPEFGMAGFLLQVITAYAHIAQGTLDGRLLPWHPPPAYPAAGCVVIRSDLPRARRASDAAVVAWAAGVRVNADRIDIIAWPDFTQEIEQAVQSPADAYQCIQRRLRDLSDAAFLVPALAIPRPIAFEYSYLMQELIEKVAEPQAALLLYRGILHARAFNAELRQQEEPEPPAIFLLRAPADTRFSATDAEAHFAAGVLRASDSQLSDAVFGENALGQLLARLWLLSAPILWTEVYDSRPEMLLRRGAGRPMEKVIGSRVLVLGCGALGAQIAEHCVRAGAARVHVVDSDKVTPGVLLRQPYEDRDIGRPKATTLAGRLNRIRPDTQVSASVADILSLPLPCAQEPGPPDLIIDATANRAVASMIERLRRNTPDTWPPLVTLGISQTATAGIAAVTPGGFTGAGVDLLRKLGVATSQDGELADIHAEFFPPPSERTLFQPEPGCSDTTFAGSATDVSALAAQLLDGALTRLTALTLGTPPARPTRGSLCIARLGRDAGRRPARVTLDIPPDLILDDHQQAYQVRLDPRAAQEMLSIATMAAQDPASSGHTGGLLLGQFSQTAKIAWVTDVTDPPVGSTASHLGLELDVPRAQEELQARHQQSRGLLSLIGFWHVHHGSPEPSDQDRRAMGQALCHAPQLLLLVVGFSEQPSSSCAMSPSTTPTTMHAEVFTP
jgi:hypothetical protein